ncbi:MAG: hypothetical protein QM737_18910 [Ferruginibacter sp.]
MGIQYIDVILKGLGILLSTIALLQLLEVRKKRHIDMYWKVYEIYVSEIQTIARKNTVKMGGIFNDKVKSGVNEKDLIEFYSSNYHLTTIDNQKMIDSSIMNRVRFLNLTGTLIKQKLVNKNMLFELIGIAFEEDYSTLKRVLETHRKDHGTPQMYSAFEKVMEQYKIWKKDNNFYFSINPIHSDVTLQS